MIPLFEINVHQVGILHLVERDCHHRVIHFVEINVYQGIPLVEIGD